MATAEVVNDDVVDAQGLTGTLFRSQKFWLSARVPQRLHFKAQIEANGGVVVKSEREADVKIVDHLTKEVIPETYSFKFIEQSIRNGRLENLSDYAIGPCDPIPRPVSSPSRPRKQTRTAYSDADDRFLWKWMYKCEAQGRATQGNEIFKSLEAVNSRHPWQSWRDRWIKILKYRKPPPDLQQQEDADEEPSVDASNGGSLTHTRTGNNSITNPPRKAPAKGHAAAQPSKKARSQTGLDGSLDSEEDDAYAEGDIEDLLKSAKDILNMSPRNAKQAWKDYSGEYSHRDPWEWQEFFRKKVLPEYRASRVNAIPFTKTSPRFASYVRPKPNPTAQDGANPSTSPSDQSSELLNGNATTRSPSSFHPDTSRIKPRSTPGSQRQVTLPEHPKTLTPRDGKDQGGGLTSSKSPTTLATSSYKRKALAEDEANANDRSASGRLLHPSKKPRQEDAHHSDIQEILSTPDKTQEHVSTPRPKTPTKSPRKPLLIDQEDEETEDEAEPTPIGATVPSQSLSEPSWTPKPRQNATLDYEPASAQPPSARTPSPVPVEEPQFETAPSEQFETAPTQLPEPDSQLRSPSLIKIDAGESGARSLDTQAILTASTQIPDFTLAEPEGDWSAYEPPSGTGETIAESDPTTIDYSVAAPPGGWEDEAALPPTNESSSVPPAQTQAPSAPISLSEWLTFRTSNGITRQQASAALMSTSGDADLADTVLEYQRGRPEATLPPMRGVWTDKDDMDLQGGDGRGIKRVMDKHGNDGVKARWEFWDKWREH